jgi:hypothetical protein
MADRCLACHADVQAELQAKNGLHGKLLGESPTSPTCRGCHPEHGGPNGALTAVNEATFPHGMTGYSLTSHQKKRDGHAFVCADCHPTRLSQFDQAVCADCHRGLDAAFMSRHEATFGQDCLPCHDGSGKNGADFDHSKLPFKLTGKHAGVACEKCHTNARSLSELQKTPQTCFACHQFKDKHAGKFGQDCGQCHTTATWANAKFDHTIFPVDHGSREMIATCATCHPQGTSTYTCYGCHAHTPANVLGEHEGKQPSELQDCVRCHEGGKGGG